MNRLFYITKNHLTAAAPLSLLLSAVFAIVFLLSFDRRTDGLCSILTWVVIGIAFWLVPSPRLTSMRGAWSALPTSARVSLAALAAWVLTTGASHLWSYRVAFTAESFFREVLPQTGIFLVVLWLGHACAAGDFAKNLLRLTRALCVLALIMTGVMLVAALADPEVLQKMARLRLLLLIPDDPHAPWRLMFPCNTHNKTGFLCMFMGYTMLAALLCVPVQLRRRWDVPLLIVGCVAAIIALLGTLTRGIMFSVVVGVILMFAVLLRTHAASLRKATFAIGALLVLMLGVAFTASPAWRDYVRQPFAAASWQANGDTTTGMRLFLWEHTATMVAERPVLGYGGGWEIYYNAFAKRFPEYKGRFAPSEYPPHHSHNVYLQVLFETGFVGLTFFTLFQLARLWTVGTALLAGLRSGNRSRLRLMALIVAVELSFHLYSFSNYPMRRGMGLLIFIVWGACLAAALVVKSASLTDKR